MSLSKAPAIADIVIQSRETDDLVPFFLRHFDLLHFAERKVIQVTVRRFQLLPNRCKRSANDAEPCEVILPTRWNEMRTPDIVSKQVYPQLSKLFCDHSTCEWPTPAQDSFRLSGATPYSSRFMQNDSTLSVRTSAWRGVVLLTDCLPPCMT